MKKTIHKILLLLMSAFVVISMMSTYGSSIERVGYTGNGDDDDDDSVELLETLTEIDNPTTKSNVIFSSKAPASGEENALGIPVELSTNDFTIFSDPSQVVNFGTVYGEFFQDHPWGGVSVKLPLDIKLAVFIAKPYAGLANSYVFTTPGALYEFDYTQAEMYNSFSLWREDGFLDLDGDGNEDVTALMQDFIKPKNRVDVLLGRKFGKIAVGAKFNWADNKSSNSFKSASLETNSSEGSLSVDQKVTDYHLTVGAHINKFLFFKQICVVADAGLMRRSMMFSMDTAYGRVNSFSIKSSEFPTLSGYARAIVQLGKFDIMVPLSYSRYDLSWNWEQKRDDNGDSDFSDSSDLMIQGGMKDILQEAQALASVKYKPHEKLLVLLSTGAELTYREIQVLATTNGFGEEIGEGDSLTYFDLRIPVGISAEHQTTDKLTLRVGIQTIIYRWLKTHKVDRYWEDTEMIGESEYSSDQRAGAFDTYQVSLGLGFKPVEKVDLSLAFRTDDFDIKHLITQLSMKLHF